MSAFFKDKVVLITGASSGIGQALAVLCAAQGAKLSLVARSQTGLEETARLCSGETEIHVCDVTNPTQCEEMIADVVEKWGRIDLLMNNAGVTTWAKFEEISDLAPFKSIMETNFWGSVYCTKAALPHLINSKGQIAVVSSLTGLTGVPTRSLYAASKHALHGFFDSLRIELLDKGVSVSIICPGFVQSQVRGKAIGADGQSLGESPIDEGKVMTAADCARQILQAIEKRQRLLVMTTKGKVGRWLKLFAPTLVDRIAANAIKNAK